MEELCCIGEVVEGIEDMRWKARLFFQQLYTEDVNRRSSLDNLHFSVLCVKSRDGLEVLFVERKLKVDLMIVMGRRHQDRMVS